MNAVLGHLGVWLGFVAALAGLGIAAYGLLGGVRQADRSRARPAVGLLDPRPYAPLILVGAVIAVIAMEHALVTHDFSLTYVADNNARVTPLIYSITGMWSALAGSILLWSLLLAVFTLALVWYYRRRSDDLVVRWATLVMFAVAAFFFGLMAGPSDPFQTVPGHAPLTGAGPNALLQDNPLVAIHPPLLYLGFVGFTVPFAFTIGMLVTGRVGEGWHYHTRRWTLLAWTFLSVGIVLGAWWSYQVLGWGGFWGWDPVENAALLPWLCGTAYLHSILVQQRRGLLRVWNMSLSIAIFALTILGTFLTRSGVIQSVHAFSESDIGPILIGFFLAIVVVGFGLIAWRGDRLRSPGGIDAPLGREGAFLLNNLLFVGFAFVVLLGTLFPLLYQALDHQSVTVGAPYFDVVAIPVALALLLLMAIAPALSWRKIDASVLWQRLAIPAWIGVLTVVGCVLGGLRGLAPLLAFGLGAFAASSALRSLVLSIRTSVRHGSGPWRGLVGRANGGMIVHLGVVVLAVGITAASAYTQRGEVALRAGQSAVFDGRTITYQGLRTVNTPARRATEAVLKVDGGGPFYPATSQYGGAASQVVGTPAIDSGFTGDVYLTLDQAGTSGASGGQVVPGLGSGQVAIGVVVEPLVAWMWVGGLIVGIGGVLALVPGSRRRPTEPVSAPTPRRHSDDRPGDGDQGLGPSTNGRRDGEGEPVPAGKPSTPIPEGVS